MRVIRNALLGILIMTSASGVIVALPAEAADLYMPGVYKAVPKRLLSYPYGGTYLNISYAKRSYGYPNVGFYYGDYRSNGCLEPVWDCR